MKPTEKQVREWLRSAQTKADSDRPVVQIVAELAAQWGASQAQQTTEPELPEAVAYMFFARKKPEIKHLSWQKEPSTRQKGLGFVTTELFTAAQMQAYADAKVREAMAQQAIQRGLDKILADPERYGLDLGEKQ